MISIVKVNESERKKLFAYAKANDVRKTGVFDARGDHNFGAINCWSKSWDTEENTESSKIVGTIQLFNDRIEIESQLVSLLIALPVRAVSPVSSRLTTQSITA